jgi:4a-hydroxytetrahydrobiopterin dehydratase
LEGTVEFVNQLGEIAEAEGHHPDIHLSWGRVRVTIYTHKIDGLTESGFILAAKYDECYRAQFVVTDAR